MPRHTARPLRPPALRLLPATAVGAVVLLWALGGWAWTVLGIALAVAVVVAVVARAVTLLFPREGRWIGDRADVLALGGALVYLLTQSTAAAIVLVAGLAVGAIGLAVHQKRTRAVALILSLALTALGSAGLVLGTIRTHDEQEAQYRAAGDASRAQILPRSPEAALAGLMAAMANPDPADCAALFSDDGRAAFATAYGVPDCLTALRLARGAITDPGGYTQRVDGGITVQRTGNSATVNGCGLRWRPTLNELLNGTPPGGPTAPGPPPGQITTHATYGDRAWVIDSYRRCPSLDAPA